MLRKLKVQVKNLSQSRSYVDYAQKKFASLTKFLKGADNAKWNIRLSKEGGVKKGEIYHAEAQIKTPKKNYGAEADGETPYEAIDEVKAELAKKITHHKDKKITRVRKGALRAKQWLRRER